MEKQGRSKGNVFQFIPGANSVTFSKPSIISPGRDKGSRPENWNKFKANNFRRGFSGPITSMIPAEARRKSRSGSFDAAEPTSPKVSCMGQIILKHKKLKNKNKNKDKDKDKDKNKDKDRDKNQNQNQKRKKMVISKSIPSSSHRDSYKVESPQEAKKKAFSGILRIFQTKRSDSDVLFDDHDKDRAVQVQSMAAPSLGKMKRFASGRGSLGNFDWTAHVPAAAAAVSDDRNYHSDEEGGVGGGGGGGEGGRKSDGEGDDDSIIIPHSAPIIVVGGRVALEPRKEVNLWKRRTMGPPRPLQLIPSK